MIGLITKRVPAIVIAGVLKIIYPHTMSFS